MITFLRGKLVEAAPTLAVVEVHGVGYEVLIPLSTFEKLPVPGQEVQLLTQFVVREDAHQLYGFLSASERDLFRMLVHTVSGIGPKIALSVLSGMPLAGFRAAVVAGDVRALSSISGVGKKTAERIVVELKDKMGGFGTPGVVVAGGAVVSAGSDSGLNDAVLALTALGIRPGEALEAARAAMAVLGPDAGVDRIVRACLKRGGAA